MMRNFILCLIAASLLVSCSQRDRFITITGFAQGGTYTVKLNMKGVAVRPETIRDSVDSILRDIDNSISGYNRKSLLSRFNAGETVRPDGIFINIYHHAYDIYEHTSGVVDVALAPLFDIWGFGFRNDSLPSSDKVAQVMAESGMNRLRDSIVLREDGTLVPEDLLLEGTVPLQKGAAMPKLNYNAIAQGYSCDLVAGYLYSIGVRDMMVDIGEIFCDGCNPSGQPWSLGIDRPVDGNNELGAQIHGIFRAPQGPHGIVTSGNYRKFYIRDGKKYSHSIDPRTGYPVQHSLLSATIVAEDAMTADAYATYCMVIGLDEAKSFLASRPDLEGCFIYDDNGTFATWCSEGFLLESL